MAMSHTLRDNIDRICHFHAAACGRNEIDDTQELNYRFVAKAIVDTDITDISPTVQPSQERCDSKPRTVLRGSNGTMGFE